MRKRNGLEWLMMAVLVTMTLMPSGGAFAQQAAADDFIVITLGTGDPTPSMKRFGPATLVKAGTEILLFDAGRGAAQRVWQTGTNLGSINGMFLTHLHSDHIVGIPDVWLTGWLPAPFAIRKAPMRVWGPKGTKSMMSGLENAYDWDIEVRIADQKLAKEAIAIDAHEIEQGVVYEQNGVKVTAFEVDHGDLIKPCFGYRIDYDGRSVVISGDTKFSENLIKFATGADLLIHQAAMAKEELLNTSIAFRYIIDHHTRPDQAGTVFARTKPKQAALYHIVLLTNGKIPAPTEQDVVDGVRTNYAGPLVVAEDMMRFTITRDGVQHRMP